MKKVSTRSGKAGLPPGTLIHVGDELSGTTSLRQFVLANDGYHEEHLSSLDGLRQSDPATTVSWLDIDGLNSERLLRSLGEQFGLHHLMLEDILNTDHRPKVEEYQDALFVVAKMISIDKETDGIDNEQICFILRKGMVISVQERPGDVLDPIRERIRNDLGRVRRAGADYLLYALLDVIVDQYFVVVESLGKRIEQLERKVLVTPGNEDLVTIQELRSNLIHVNRVVTPTRELAGRLNSLQSHLIEKPTRRYINDLQDHTVYIAETIATFREMLASLENTYHAGQNARMTQVMKLLTIISTIFIPLTFIAGVYGMNFDHMPELRWKYGYFTVMGVMTVLALLMLLWFRRKRWL
ncbi:MAG: magnesium/cobalt transporter CorA [Flavobacteriales bacterium]|nr:magnesium/cobalt transporter CorA [Flavobacteriales bacterium]